MIHKYCYNNKKDYCYTSAGWMIKYGRYEKYGMLTVISVIFIIFLLGPMLIIDGILILSGVTYI